MTLKEIEKIIDEADSCFLKEGDDVRTVMLLSKGSKNLEKRRVESKIENGCTYVFIKLNYKGEVKKRWAVDHIDEYN